MKSAYHCRQFGSVLLSGNARNILSRSDVGRVGDRMGVDGLICNQAVAGSIPAVGFEISPAIPQQLSEVPGASIFSDSQESGNLSFARQIKEIGQITFQEYCNPGGGRPFRPSQQSAVAVEKSQSQAITERGCSAGCARGLARKRRTWMSTPSPSNRRTA